MCWKAEGAVISRKTMGNRNFEQQRLLESVSSRRAYAQLGVPAAHQMILEMFRKSQVVSTAPSFVFSKKKVGKSILPDKRFLLIC